MSQKRLLALAACTFALSLWAAFASLPPAEPVSALAADKLVHDFGTLRQGETVTAEFELVNRSDVPVRIVHVNNSCDCTLARWTQEPLAPGATTRVGTTWHTLAARGEVVRTLDVLSLVEGSPDPQVLRLILRARIDPEYNFEPGELVFQAGQAATRSVRFHPNRATEVVLKECYCSHPSFTARLTSASEVEVAFNGAQTGGGFDEVQLVVITASDVAEQCAVPIRVE
jgi:hypothetical protein